jgi:hypothetical protein
MCASEAQDQTCPSARKAHRDRELWSCGVRLRWDLEMTQEVVSVLGGVPQRPDAALGVSL